VAFSGNNDQTTIRQGIDLAKRTLAIGAGLALLVSAVAAAAAYLIVAAALPRRSGQAQLAGLTAPLAVALDSRSIATVRGESFDDVLRGQGYPRTIAVNARSPIAS
jgi:hypothetical protein